MPIYEYRCRKCGKEFDVFKKITEPDEKNCKFCNGTVDKLISLSSFQLQGSGWYVTDYGGKKPKATDFKKEEVSSEPKKQESVSATSEKN
jgi:putative FmdB family regulatory protein